MNRRISTLHRLALKERVLINRQMRGLGVLNSEFQRIDEMRKKLSEMAGEHTHDNGEQVMSTFRIAAQLNHQIRDQLAMANNRCDHLAQELQTMRYRIAQADRRREKSTKKADALRVRELNDRVAKREDAEASRRRSKLQ